MKRKIKNKSPGQIRGFDYANIFLKAICMLYAILMQSNTTAYNPVTKTNSHMKPDGKNLYANPAYPSNTHKIKISCKAVFMPLTINSFIRISPVVTQLSTVMCIVPRYR